MNSQFKHRLRRAQQQPLSSRSDTDDLDNPFDVSLSSPARRLFATAADIQPPSSASTATGSIFGDATAISSRASSPSSSSTPPLLGPAFSATGTPLSSPRKRKRSANNASPDRFIPTSATGAYSLLDDSISNGGLGSAFAGPSTPSKSQAKRFIEMDAQTDQANQAFNEALSSELLPSSSSSSSASGSRSPLRSPIRASNAIGSVITSGTTIITTSSPHRHQVHHTASSPHRPPQTPRRSRLLSFESPQSANRPARGNGPVFSSSGIALNAGRGLDSPRHEMYNTSPIRESTQDVLLSQRKLIRPVAKTPFKVLDAPDLMDDFYLNLVDWSSTNVLAVGLASCVYLWSANTSKVVKLCDLEGDNVSGLAWERNA
ncbi:substrate-specific activator of APC-dependent proteolysis, partial [Tulasnella sp. 332]